MIKAVLFDFDDTLGNREVYAYQSYEEKLKQTNPQLKGAELEAVLQECMILDQQGDVNKNYVRDRLLQAQGIDLGEDFNSWWFQNQWKYAVLFDDALPTLKALKEQGYLLGLVTNGSSFGQNMKVKKTGIGPYMDVVAVSGDIQIQKPDPGIFRYAAEKLGVKCEECVFVGDMYHRDIIGAYNVGMKPVWIWTHGPRLTAFTEIPKIAGISEILDVLKQL